MLLSFDFPWLPLLKLFYVYLLIGCILSEIVHVKVNWKNENIHFIRKVSAENDIFRKPESSFLNAGEVNISLEKGYV